MTTTNQTTTGTRAAPEARTMYTLADGGSEREIHALDLDDARRQAREWARGGSWGEDGATVEVAIHEGGRWLDATTTSAVVAVETVEITAEVRS